MKVIDLLNKIAKGEETPNKIKWNGYVYEKVGNEYFEVEIIEENKKIEKVKKIYEFETANIIEMGIIQMIGDYAKKQDELIDEVNKLKEEKWNKKV